jgi:hypothetical protein
MVSRQIVDINSKERSPFSAIGDIATRGAECSLSQLVIDVIGTTDGDVLLDTFGKAAKQKADNEELKSCLVRMLVPDLLALF